MTKTKNSYFHLPDKWQNLLQDELQKPYLKRLLAFLENEPKVLPKQPDLFRALQLVGPDEVKVVILGQDPYHGENQANGLAFSVNPGMIIPPSLKNIYVELRKDVGSNYVKLHNGDLTSWAKQGVVLLNTTLTVAPGSPGSHYGRGWETLTDRIIEAIAKHESHKVFVLWGKKAQEKAGLIQDQGRNYSILQAPHPSPFSARTGFFGSRPFSKCNTDLIRHGIKPIDW